MCRSTQKEGEMRSEKDIRIRIAQIKQENEHLFSGSLATVEINAPRALGQIAVVNQLQVLSWTIGETFNHEWEGKPNS